MYPFLDNDPDLDREDFLPDFLELMETDDGLYNLGVGFYIQGSMMLIELKESVSDWSLGTMYSLVEETGADLFNIYTTRKDFFNILLGFSEDSWVDWEQKVCNFEDESFLQALSLARNMPDTFEWDEVYSGNIEYENSSDRLFRGEQLIDNWGAGELAGLYMLGYSDGNDAAFTYGGFPSVQGESYGAGLSLCLGMSAVTENPDGAWIFIREMLTNDSAYFGLPVLTQQLESTLQQEMEFYQDRTINPGLSSGQTLTLTQADIDQLHGIIDSITCILHSDQTIIDIILEEAASYFSGGRIYN